MTDFLVGLGIALVLEGVLYGLFPETMRRLLAQALAAPPETLRVGALLLAATGVAIVWLARS